MPKKRTTVTLDEAVLAAVRLRATRVGKRNSQVVEEALRRDLGLDLLDRLWAKNDLADDVATALAREAQLSVRGKRR
jgi:Arc/MetJ family transcription regulator